MIMKEKLQKLGFTPNEAIIYCILIEYGELNASEISKKASIDRSVTYNILDNLILKGYVSHILKNGKKVFLINDVESLIEPLKEKIVIASDLSKKIKQKQKSETYPIEVSVHEGKNALKTLDAEWLYSKKIYGLNVIGMADKVIPYKLEQIRKNAHKNTKAKVIVANEQGKEAMKLYGITPKVLPEKYMNKAPIIIHNDIVLITTFENEKPYCIRIKNKTIAHAFKKDFELMWDLMD